MSKLKEGDKVEVKNAREMNDEEFKKLRVLNFVVTIEELDVIDGQVYGFYSEEFPSYLFTVTDIV